MADEWAWDELELVNEQAGGATITERDAFKLKQVPMWTGPTGCVGNLSGSWTGTLEEPVIGDAGRQFLAALLLQLSDRQSRHMFEAARVHLRPRDPENGRSGFPSADEWVTAFKQKRAEIVERRCGA